jgi:hypothetical protein
MNFELKTGRYVSTDYETDASKNLPNGLKPKSRERRPLPGPTGALWCVFISRGG